MFRCPDVPVNTRARGASEGAYVFTVQCLPWLLSWKLQLKSHFSSRVRRVAHPILEGHVRDSRLWRANIARRTSFHPIPRRNTAHCRHIAMPHLPVATCRPCARRTCFLEEMFDVESHSLREYNPSKFAKQMRRGPTQWIYFERHRHAIDAYIGAARRWDCARKTTRQSC
jgi:hypothetical protein